MEKVSFTPVLLVAAFAAFVGPLVTSPHDRAANAPFVFTPPEGFEPARDEQVKTALGVAPDGMQKVWVFAEPGKATTPNITQTFTDKTAGLEEEDLTALAAGMPAVFSPLGSTWTEVRHETRRRADGSRVGILDGALVRGESKKRVLQLVFPLDKGSALVTATVPAEDIGKWEPKLDASIASATGVFARAPKPASWLYPAWGVAGGVLAYLALALFARKKKPAPAATREPA
jgi:hypothetical protein